MEKSGAALVFVSGCRDMCTANHRVGKHPQARATDELRAGEFLLAIAGVRASDVASQEPVKEILSAPVNVSVVIGAMPATYPDVIDGESRVGDGKLRGAGAQWHRHPCPCC